MYAFLLWVGLLQDRDRKCGGFARAVLCTRKDVPAGEGDGDARFLDGRRLLEALLKDAHEQLDLEIVVLEVVPLCVGNILTSARLRLVHRLPSRELPREPISGRGMSRVRVVGLFYGDVTLRCAGGG